MGWGDRGVGVRTGGQKETRGGGNTVKSQIRQRRPWSTHTVTLSEQQQGNWLEQAHSAGDKSKEAAWCSLNWDGHYSFLLGKVQVLTLRKRMRGTQGEGNPFWCHTVVSSLGTQLCHFLTVWGLQKQPIKEGQNIIPSNIFQKERTRALDNDEKHINNKQLKL